MSRFGRLTQWALWLGALSFVLVGAAAASTPGGVPPAVTEWAGLVAILLSIGGLIYTRMTAGSNANAKSLEVHGEKLSAHEARLTKVENEIAHLPDREVAHRLELVVEKLSGRIETLDERLKPVAAIGERMQELLLEQAKK